MLKLLMQMFGASKPRPSPRPKAKPASRSKPVADRPAQPIGRERVFKVAGLEKLEGDGNYSFPVVGESNYQKSLELLAGPKEKVGKSIACVAVIEHEPLNKWDSNACPVFIDGYRVGHLAKGDAKDLIKVGGEGCCYAVDALIKGGYKTSKYSGMFGVSLDFVPRQFPATPIQKEMFRFFGLKPPSALERGEAWDREEELKTHDKYKEWSDFRLIISYLLSEEGREDYCIKKPSMKALRDAFTQLRKEGHSSESLASSMDEVVELMIDDNPNLEKA
ncbi:hypothetical protein HME01_11230 [Vreelandella aquamarina]|uniref:HIRAN domain-containing protein n=1 Tax=Vreelandella aquamarina TaxID=77097 RepID=A0A1N6HNZ1_9GAMM|nr:hypothetical protein [Halomonas meridiana]GED45271.1 hypothetical protein HME01_11230 [Halomonas meridiana]SIN62292.1 hypothetical protein SAMN05878438_0842 [Halomonas meridiana]SIN72184.1 hypothetical protein SAMN05878249_3059 [Halomonas meridiana]SIO21534.1 hypothetical protein SAMN05878442_1545 [Halomonas meridiana]